MVAGSRVIGLSGYEQLMQKESLHSLPLLARANPSQGMCLLATDLAAYFSLIFNFRPVRPYLNCPVVTATFWGEIEKHLFHHQTVMSGLWG